MRLAHVAILIGRNRVFPIGTSLSFVDVLLQIAEGFVEFQIARGLIEGTVDRFVELFLLHLSHFFNVLQLKEEQRQE